MVRIGLPRRPGPMSSTTTLYPAPNVPRSSPRNSNPNADPNQLYGVQLYGHDASHIRFAATRYATEARKLLQSLLPSTPHTSTRSGANNAARIEETTNRALVYAAESRRLLATAQTLEGGSDVLSQSFLPPSPRYKFSCALNLITTDLSSEDEAVAERFVHYARQAHELDGRGAGYAGDNRVEMCEHECRRILEAQVPNLVDDAVNQKDLERTTAGKRGRRLSQGGQRYNTARRLVVVLGALAAIAGLSGYTIHRRRVAASSSHAGGGGQVSSATDSDWNDAAFVDGTSTPTALPTAMTGAPTAEPTVYGNAAAPASAPVNSGGGDDDAAANDDQNDQSNQGNDAIATGTAGSTFLTDLRSNPWALGTIAGSLSLVVIGLLAVVFRRNPDKSEPLIDSSEVAGQHDDKQGGGDGTQKPAAVAVAVGDFHVNDPEYQSKVVVKDPAAAVAAAAAPAAVATEAAAVQQTLPVERSQSSLSARDQIRQIPVQRSSSAILRALSAKDKVQHMIEAEQMSRRIQAAVNDGKRSAGGVRFRAGDDSLVSDTGVPNVPRYSQKETKAYAPPPMTLGQSSAVGADRVSGNEKNDQHGRPLPPLQLQ